MKVSLIAYTPDPEMVVAAAAKTCYTTKTIDELMDNLVEESAEQFIDMLGNIGHESPIEHASFTFAIEGVSRSL
ncbi:MAG: FAD-dependent thymidylate synthase, partial [Clostridia bacterium]|nr:FAD-dependent thymidylate synthase [Clostridia bacterium]